MNSIFLKTCQVRSRFVTVKQSFLKRLQQHSHTAARAVDVPLAMLLLLLLTLPSADPNQPHSTIKIKPDFKKRKKKKRLYLTPIIANPWTRPEPQQTRNKRGTLKTQLTNSSSPTAVVSTAPVGVQGFGLRRPGRRPQLSTLEDSGWRGGPPPSWSTWEVCWQRRRPTPWSPADWSRGRARSRWSPAGAQRRRPDLTRLFFIFKTALFLFSQHREL